MSKTHKDLKSHKKGFGKYKFSKPKRKLTPLSRDSDKITGENHSLVFIENDIKQDDFSYDKNKKPSEPGHWYNAKAVKSIRKQLRAARKEEKSSARGRLKNELKKKIKDLE